jgi:hypothetical protein
MAWAMMPSISRGLRRPLTMHTQASRRLIAKAITPAAAQFSPTISTRSPARTPQSPSCAAASMLACCSWVKV